MVAASWRSSVVLVLLALPGIAAPSSEARVVQDEVGSVAAFPDAEGVAETAIATGVAAFPDLPQSTPDRVGVLLARNPYSDVLAALAPIEHALENPYAAARHERSLGSTESSPYQFGAALANPYTDAVRIANPYTEELELRNPYTALRR